MSCWLKPTFQYFSSFIFFTVTSTQYRQSILTIFLVGITRSNLFCNGQILLFKQMIYVFAIENGDPFNAGLEAHRALRAFRTPPPPSNKFLLDKYFHKLIILQIYICQHGDRNICLVKVGTIYCSGKKPDCLPDGDHCHFILQPFGRKRALSGNLYAGCQAPVYLSKNVESCCYRKLNSLKQVK